jgi:hypothetical protein
MPISILPPEPNPEKVNLIVSLLLDFGMHAWVIKLLFSGNLQNCPLHAVIFSTKNMC